MVRRRGSKSLGNSAEFLRRVEEIHHFVQRAKVGLRMDAQDRLTLDRLGDELQLAYLAISGEPVVPWAFDTTTSSRPRLQD